MALGREQLNWSDSVWKTLDDAVRDEFHRTAVGLILIPFHGQADNAVTAPADVIDVATMTVNEADIAALVELGIDFGLTRQQVAGEEQDGTGVTLGTRAANPLAQAQDLVIFLGDAAFKAPLFTRVSRRGGSGGPGLLGPAAQAVGAAPLVQGGKHYGEHSSKAVAEVNPSLKTEQGEGLVVASWQ